MKAKNHVYEYIFQTNCIRLLRQNAQEEAGAMGVSLNVGHVWTTHVTKSVAIALMDVSQAIRIQAIALKVLLHL